MFQGLDRLGRLDCLAAVRCPLRRTISNSLEQRQGKVEALEDASTPKCHYEAESIPALIVVYSYPDDSILHYALPLPFSHLATTLQSLKVSPSIILINLAILNLFGKLPLPLPRLLRILELESMLVHGEPHGFDTLVVQR